MSVLNLIGRLLVVGVLIAAISTGFNGDQRITQTGVDADPIPAALLAESAYNSIDDQLLVVWVGDPEGDHIYEVFGQLLDGTSGGPIGGAFQISDTDGGSVDAFAERLVSVVHNPDRNQYMVVWAAAPPNLTTEIYGRRLAANGSPVDGVDRRLSDMGASDADPFYALSPDVAYDPDLKQYLVVWWGDDDTDLLVAGHYEIFGQFIDGKTGKEISSDIRISTMGGDRFIGFSAKYPAVVYNGVEEEFFVVWEGDDFNSGPSDITEIYFQRIDAATGGVLGQDDFLISLMGNSVSDEFRGEHPDVAFNPDDNEYFVVWHGDDNESPLVDNEFEVFGRFLDGATGGALTKFFPVSDMGVIAGNHLSAGFPAVTYNPIGKEFLVAWHGQDAFNPVAGEDEIYAQRISASGAEIGENDFLASHAGPDDDLTIQATHADVVYNSSDNTYLLTWMADDNGTDNEFEIFGWLTPTCDGDANGDLVIDAADNGFIQARFGCATGVGDEGCDEADVNGDGAVDAADTGFVQARFGNPCLPS